MNVADLLTFPKKDSAPIGVKNAEVTYLKNGSEPVNITPPLIGLQQESEVKESARDATRDIQ